MTKSHAETVAGLRKKILVKVGTAHRQAEKSPIIGLSKHIREGGLLNDFKGWDGDVQLRGNGEIREVLARTVKVMHAAQTTGGRGERPTGFDRVDRLTAGLHPELVLIGGRPGMAKTALGCAIAMNRAARPNWLKNSGCAMP